MLTVLLTAGNYVNWKQCQYHQALQSPVTSYITSDIKCQAALLISCITAIAIIYNKLQKTNYKKQKNNKTKNKETKKQRNKERNKETKKTKKQKTKKQNNIIT